MTKRKNIKSYIKKKGQEVKNPEVGARFAVFEIVMARFNKVASVILAKYKIKLILKGGFAVYKRSKTNAFRPTKDLDFTVAFLNPQIGTLDEATVRVMANEISGSADFTDGCVVTITQLVPYHESPLNGCWKVMFDVSCEGKRLGASGFNIDFSFGDYVNTTTAEIEIDPDLSTIIGAGDFAMTPTITLEQQVAEKLHALARLYPDGEKNPRTKDLYDVMLMIQPGIAQMDKEIIADILFEVCEYRKPVTGYSLPPELPKFPDDWRTFFDLMKQGDLTNIDYGISELSVRGFYKDLIHILVTKNKILR